MNPQIIIALAIAGASLLGGFGAGWTTQGWKRDALDLVRAQDAAKALADMTVDRDAKDAALALANDTNTAKLRKAQNETNRLRDSVYSGSVGLRLTGSSTPSLTKTSSSPSVDSGAGAELTPTAGRAYFALRDGIDYTSTQLAACQDQLRLRATLD